MLYSYCYVNSLFYAKSSGIPLSYNLFGTLECSKVKRNWIKADLLTTLDLPLIGKRIDVDGVQRLVSGNKAIIYMFCCLLQKCFGTLLPSILTDTSRVQPLLLLQMKSLLLMHSTTVLDLSYGEKRLQIVPLELSDKKKVFTQMLHKCKVTKFWDVNFKVLSRILATPVVLASVNPGCGSNMCSFCGEWAGLKHIMLHCPATVELHQFILTTFEENWDDDAWIFGHNNVYLNLLIWLVNFSKYKTHLQSFHSQFALLKLSFLNECSKFSRLFPVLEHFLSYID